VIGSVTRPPWYRHGTTPVRDPGAGPRLWVLTRSNPALHRAIAAALEPTMSHASDERVGHGRSRTLELSLFVPP